ncbi:MAG: 2Fe-2S iron-sulfur cluster binding domain-containing protein [Gammaproteobacteria bacterium]|nr:2Fe-2S iron-sulfur cluster binding domain-containing protein [Gammaproteobacteria bacterium]
MGRWMTAFRHNGRLVEVDDAERDTPLVYVLRGPPIGDMTSKLGCGSEQCGACRVLVDGTPTYACTIPARDVENRHVETAAGLDSPVRQALIEANATQCGYCLPGIIVAAEALFRVDPHPSRNAIVAALDAQLCRCGSHPRVLAALTALAEG